MVKFIPFSTNMIDPSLIYANPTQIIQKDVDKLRFDAEKAITVMENEMVVLNEASKQMSLVITGLHKHCESIDMTNAKATEIIESLNQHLDTLETNLVETLQVIEEKHKGLQEQFTVMEEKFQNTMTHVINSDMSTFITMAFVFIGILSGFMMYQMGI